MNPRISIVTICYNSAQSIRCTIDSVLSQDYANREYIIIDGASTDGTQDVVRSYGDAIDVFVSEKDNGISDAFNKGISHSTGDVIVMLNADDYMLPGVLTQFAKEFDATADIYSCNVLMKDALTGFTCREVPSTHFPVMPFFRHVAHQGCFVTSDLYRRIGGYDLNVRWPMDLEFLMRATRAGARFKRLNIDAAVFVSGGTTNSNGILRKRRDYLYVVRKNGGTVLEAWTFYVFLDRKSVV